MCENERIHCGLDAFFFLTCMLEVALVWYATLNFWRDKTSEPPNQDENNMCNLHVLLITAIYDYITVNYFMPLFNTQKC